MTRDKMKMMRNENNDEEDEDEADEESDNIGIPSSTRQGAVRTKADSVRVRVCARGPLPRQAPR